MAIKFTQKPDPEPAALVKKASEKRANTELSETVAETAAVEKAGRAKAKKPAKTAAEKDDELF